MRRQQVAGKRVLAVDYGRKRIGLALSDELGITARPLGIIERTNRERDMRRLGEICRENGVARIIVGNPRHMSGESGEMAAEAENFAKRLRKHVSIEVELVDERLTSWEAEQIRSDMGAAGRKRGASSDDVAAAVLLRDYLSQSAASASPIPSIAPGAGRA
jgi:putative holliday junction resolvase